MSGGGGGGGDVRIEPWGVAKSEATNIVNAGDALLRQPMSFFPGQTYVDPNALQLAGRANQLGYGSSNALTNLIGGSHGALQSLFQAPNVAQNPYVQGMIGATANRLGSQLFEGILPQYRQGAVGAGQYGSSRQGIAEGLAIGKSQEALANAAADIMGQAYGRGLTGAFQGASISPAVATLGLMPSQIQQQVGGMYQADQQQALQDAMARWEFGQNEPWLRTERAANIVGPLAHGGQTQITSGGSKDRVGGALSGGLLGAGLSYGLGSSGLGALGAGSGLLGGTAAMPWALPMIGAGALIGGLLG